MQFNTLSQLGSSLHASPIIDPIANKTVNVSESALESIKKMAQELQDERDMLLLALENVVKRYVGLANSGDAGYWDVEEEQEIKQARAAIKKAKND